MICSCGGATAPRSNARDSGQTVLTYERCRACGRCGEWKLYLGDVLVEKGAAAQERFNGLDRDVKKR